VSLNWPRKKIQVAPYTSLARVYNYVMRHVDYEAWAEYIHQLLSRFDHPINRVFDVACGTGNFIFELMKHDYVLGGFDYTAEMVALARKKARKMQVSIPFWRGSMLHFGLAQPQDAIVCLYDSINYLLEIEACQNFFSQAFLNLNERGVLIFDICTEWNSIRHFQDYHDKEKTGTFSVNRKSYYDKSRRIHHNDFEIIFFNEPAIFFEQHVQRIYYIEEMRGAIPTDKFELKAIYEGFSRRKGTEDSERVHFILQKK